MLISLMMLLLFPSDGDYNQAQRKVVEAEYAFAAASRAKGVTPAFIEYLAKDSVLFRPTPVNGQEWSKAYPLDQYLLDWQPSMSHMAVSGDLAVNTGPYLMHAKGDPPKLLATGSFVSMWRKQDDGSWRVALDIGVDHKATLPEKKWMPGIRDEPVAPATDEDHQKVLEQYDRTLAEASEKFAAAFYNDVPTLYLQNGNEPTDRRPTTSPKTGELLGSGISSAGDLGYTYGKLEVPEDAQIHYYLRVWRWQGSGYDVTLEAFF